MSQPPPPPRNSAAHYRGRNILYRVYRVRLAGGRCASIGRTEIVIGIPSEMCRSSARVPSRRTGHFHGKRRGNWTGWWTRDTPAVFRVTRPDRLNDPSRQLAVIPFPFRYDDNKRRHFFIVPSYKYYLRHFDTSLRPPPHLSASSRLSCRRRPRKDGLNIVFFLLTRLVRQKYHDCSLVRVHAHRPFP